MFSLARAKAGYHYYIYENFAQIPVEPAKNRNRKKTELFNRNPSEILRKKRMVPIGAFDLRFLTKISFLVRIPSLTISLKT